MTRACPPLLIENLSKKKRKKKTGTAGGAGAPLHWKSKSRDNHNISEFACFALSIYFFRRNRMETIFI